MLEPLATALGWLPHELALLVETLLEIVALLVPLLVTVAGYIYAERKVIGYMRVRPCRGRVPAGVSAEPKGVRLGRVCVLFTGGCEGVDERKQDIGNALAVTTTITERTP